MVMKQYSLHPADRFMRQRGWTKCGKCTLCHDEENAIHILLSGSETQSGGGEAMFKQIFVSC